MRSKLSVKMSDENLEFWKNLNRNCIKTDKLEEARTPSDLQTAIVKYFKLNNDRYLEVLELIGNMEKNNKWN